MCQQCHQHTPPNVATAIPSNTGPTADKSSPDVRITMGTGATHATFHVQHLGTQNIVLQRANDLIITIGPTPALSPHSAPSTATTSPSFRNAPIAKENNHWTHSMNTYPMQNLPGKGEINSGSWLWPLEPAPASAAAFVEPEPAQPIPGAYPESSDDELVRPWIRKKDARPPIVTRPATLQRQKTIRPSRRKRNHTKPKKNNPYILEPTSPKDTNNEEAGGLPPKLATPAIEPVFTGAQGSHSGKEATLRPATNETNTTIEPSSIIRGISDVPQAFQAEIAALTRSAKQQEPPTDDIPENGNPIIETPEMGKEGNGEAIESTDPR